MQQDEKAGKTKVNIYVLWGMQTCHDHACKTLSKYVKAWRYLTYYVLTEVGCNYLCDDGLCFTSQSFNFYLHSQSKAKVSKESCLQRDMPNVNMMYMK